MKACLICNPASGSYHQEAVDGLLLNLSSNGVPCTVVNTSQAGDGKRLAEQNCGDYDIVIACGGDGTINEVINGLPRGAVLGIIPMGSANVLAHELGTISIEQACAAIVRGQTRPMSLGLLDVNGEKTRFSLMAGFGADGLAVENLQLAEKKEMGIWAYIVSALRQLWNWESSLAEAQTESSKATFHTMMVCNASHYGGHFTIAHNTSIYIPHFEVVYTKKGSRLEFLGMCMRLIMSWRQKCYFITNQIEITGRKAIQADGEFIGYSPARVQLLPDFLQIIC